MDDLTEKTPGQVKYEAFCAEEYRKPNHPVWNRWEVLTPEEQAKWEADAMRWGAERLLLEYSLALPEAAEPP